MKWIDAKKEPPEKGSDFLGSDGQVIFAAYWIKDCEQWKVGGWENCHYCGGFSNVCLTESNYTTKKITHWMPLPNRPA